MENLDHVKIVVEDLRILAEQWSQQGIEYLQKIPPGQLYAAIGVLLLSTILLFFTFRLVRRTKSNTVLLSGLSGSGKTVLFHQLRDGSSHQGTVTSMEPNEGTFVFHTENTKKGKINPVHLVDVPGHSRLRPKLEEFLPQAAAIVFVVDALEFLPVFKIARHGNAMALIANSDGIIAITTIASSRLYCERYERFVAIVHGAMAMNT